MIGLIYPEPVKILSSSSHSYNLFLEKFMKYNLFNSEDQILLG